MLTRGDGFFGGGGGWNYMSRYEQQQYQEAHGATYEQQEEEKIYTLASLGGYEAQDGSIYFFDNNGQLTVQPKESNQLTNNASGGISVVKSPSPQNQDLNNIPLFQVDMLDIQNGDDIRLNAGSTDNIALIFNDKEPTLGNPPCSGYLKSCDGANYGGPAQVLYVHARIEDYGKTLFNSKGWDPGHGLPYDPCRSYFRYQIGWSGSPIYQYGSFPANYYRWFFNTNNCP